MVVGCCCCCCLLRGVFQIREIFCFGFFGFVAEIVEYVDDFLWCRRFYHAIDIVHKLKCFKCRRIFGPEKRAKMTLFVHIVAYCKSRDPGWCTHNPFSRAWLAFESTFIFYSNANAGSNPVPIESNEDYLFIKQNLCFLWDTNNGTWLCFSKLCDQIPWRVANSEYSWLLSLYIL